MYKFKIAEKMFALDVEKCFFFEIDEISWEVLDYYDKIDTESVLGILEQRFPSEDLKKVIQELNSLREAGHIMADAGPDLPLKEDGLKSISLQVGDNPDNSGNSISMTQVTARNAINFLIMKSGENKTLKVNFIVASSLSNIEIIEDISNYAQKLGETFKKSLVFGLTLAGIPPDDGTTNLGDADISLDFDRVEDIRKVIERLAREKRRGDVKLSRIGKIFLSGNRSPRVVLRPVNLKFSEAIADLFRYGFRDICLGCHGSLSHLSSGDEAKIFEEYDTLARDYIDRFEEEASLSLHPFASIFNQVGEGEKCMKRCEGGGGNLTVDAGGDLYPCPRFWEAKEYRMGNVNASEYNLELEEQLSAGTKEKESCKDCWARYICGGGCPALAFYHNRDTRKPYEEECRSNQYIAQLGIMVYSTLHDRGLAKRALALADQPFISFSTKDGKITLRSVEEGDLPIISQWDADFVNNCYFLSEQVGSGGLGAQGGQGVIELLIEDRDKLPLGLLRLRTFPPVRKGEISLFTPYKERLKEKEFYQMGISMLRHLFRIWRLPRIYATFLETETEHIEYLMQFGFKPEGVLREHLFHKGRYHNLITLGYVRGFVAGLLQKFPVGKG